MVADEDSIAIAYTLSGTQNGPLMGIAFKDGRMVERWGSSDQLGMLEQLGSAKGL